MARQPARSAQRLAEVIAEAIDASGLMSGFETERSEPKDKGSPKNSRVRKTSETHGEVHRLDDHFVCRTDNRGHKTPAGQSMTEIVLDASEGFIPLWDYGVTLRWCFDEAALADHDAPNEVRSTTRDLIQEAVLAWGDSAPIKFTEERDAYDFKIVVNTQDRCSAFGCTLASAFFPDSGRHELHVYPKMFGQPHKEQIDTLIHEIGHIFGLRHFFADVSETAFPSVIFGKHDKFTIMNYGGLSELTDADKYDLKRLYEAVWSGNLTQINGTPVRLFRPYHESGELVKPRFIVDASPSR